MRNLKGLKLLLKSADAPYRGVHDPRYVKGKFDPLINPESPRASSVYFDSPEGKAILNYRDTGSRTALNSVYDMLQYFQREKPQEYPQHKARLRPMLDAAEKNVRQHTLDLSTDKIKEYENFSATPYQTKLYTDKDGNPVYDVPTIGYGTTRINGEPVTMDTPPTDESTAAQYLQDHIMEHVVPRLRQTYGSRLASMTHGQRAALTSLGYNIYNTMIPSKSTLARRIQNGEDVGTVIEEEFPRWNKANGEFMQGLLNRRNDEVRLAQTGVL